MNNSLFIDRPVFRVFTPVVTGVIIYLLILLIHNDVTQVTSDFITNELFVCIALAALVIELTRLLVRSFPFFRASFQLVPGIAILVVVVILLTAGLTLVTISGYFQVVLGYRPNLSETLPFLITYVNLAVAVLIIYVSNHFIQRSLDKQLASEIKLKEEAQENFLHLTRGINPTLLFESLEMLISLIHTNAERADDLIDDISEVYRYTLSQGQNKVVPLQSELAALEPLIRLINQLPYRKVDWRDEVEGGTHVMPGTFLQLVETIVRTTIISEKAPLSLELRKGDESLLLSYRAMDKLSNFLDRTKLDDLSRSYNIYSGRTIEYEDIDGLRKITIPLLQVQDV